MVLRPGKACRKKKPTDKFKIEEVDKKALEKAIFIEQTELYGSKWNHFEDPRGWEWIQEEIK